LSKELGVESLAVRDVYERTTQPAGLRASARRQLASAGEPAHAAVLRTDAELDEKNAGVSGCVHGSVNLEQIVRKNHLLPGCEGLFGVFLWKTEEKSCLRTPVPLRC
jgi:hypothetical protein